MVYYIPHWEPGTNQGKVYEDWLLSVSQDNPMVPGRVPGREGSETTQSVPAEAINARAGAYAKLDERSADRPIALCRSRVRARHSRRAGMGERRSSGIDARFVMQNDIQQ